MSDGYMFSDEEFWALETSTYTPLQNWKFTTSPAERTSVLDYLFQLNPQLAEMNTDPRFGELLLTAHYNNFDDQWMYDQLAGSDWGRALVLQNLDLASAGSGVGGATTAQRQANLFASLRDTASQLGLQLDETTIQDIANTAVTDNWDNARIIDALMVDADPNAIVSGDITAAADELLTYASSIRSGLTAEGAINLAMRIARGETTIAGAKSDIASNAATLNPQYANLIQKGLDINTYDTYVNSVTTAAERFGFAISPDQVASIAAQATEQNWSDQQIQQAMLKGVSATSEFTDGTLTGSRNAIIEKAASYLLPMTDGTAMNLALRIARGDLDEAGVDAMLRRQAKAATPWLADIIDSGVTTSDYFAPMREYAAQTLEMNAEDINLMNADWQDVFTTIENGATRGATLTEIGSRVRRKNEWVNTQSARSASSSVVSAVANLFGLRGF